MTFSDLSDEEMAILYYICKRGWPDSGSIDTQALAARAQRALGPYFAPIGPKVRALSARAYLHASCGSACDLMTHMANLLSQPPHHGNVRTYACYFIFLLKHGIAHLCA